MQDLPHGDTRTLPGAQTAKVHTCGQTVLKLVQGWRITLTSCATEPGYPKKCLLNLSQEKNLMRWPFSYFYYHNCEFGVEGCFGQWMPRWCCQHEMSFQRSQQFKILCYGLIYPKLKMQGEETMSNMSMNDRKKSLWSILLQVMPSPLQNWLNNT